MAKKAGGKKDKGDKKRKSSGTVSTAVVTKKSQPKVPPPPEPVVCQCNKYPGLSTEPNKLAVMGLKTANYAGLCQLLNESFGKTDRALLMTPWGSYTVFREFNGESHVYYLHDGCTCLANVFRFFDLKMGTAGLLYFQSTHEVIQYILNNRYKREQFKRLPKTRDIERLCRSFCTQGGENMFKICNRRGEISDVDDFIITQLLFPRIKRCDPNSTKSIERELPTMKYQKLFRRILEGKYRKEQRESQCGCK